MVLIRRFSTKVIFFLYLYSTVTLVTGDLFTLGAGLASLASLAYENIICSRKECCTDDWISSNYEDLNRALSAKLYGQHLAINTIITHMKGHANGQPEKALVLSFHGGTGTGKTYTSKIMAETLYKKGMKSNYVHLISATKEFPHESKVDFYKDKLKDFIEARVKECPRSLFIIEELDMMPPGILDVLLPYLEVHVNVGGVDYRNTTFIFISSTAAGDIFKKSVEHWKTRGSNRRESITLKEMEDVIRLPAYNEKSGLMHSILIKRALITAYVPFFPLEKAHVRRCIEDSLIRNKFYKSKQDIEIEKVTEIANELTYIPKDLLVFANLGCKRVDQKVDYVYYL